MRRVGVGKRVERWLARRELVLRRGVCFRWSEERV